MGAGANLTRQNSTEDPVMRTAKVTTDDLVDYRDIALTSTTFTTYQVVNNTPFVNGSLPHVGDVLQLLIQSRDVFGNPQTRGGDFWLGVLKDPTRKAYTAGRVTDFNNGTYLMTFVLAWSGKANVDINLVYPSRVTHWMRTRFRADDHAPQWQGTFRRGNASTISECAITYGVSIPSNVCVYKNYHALRKTRFFCKKPPGMLCGNLVGHRNVLSFGKVTGNIMRTDHIDVFRG